MINSKLNLKIVRASAWYDLLATATFVTPWSTSLITAALTTLTLVLGLDRPIPSLNATQMLLANLLGSVVVVWSLWRLNNPSRRVGVYDAIARGLFAVWQLYAISQGATLLILAFTVMEIIFGIAQLIPVRRTGQVKMRSRSDDANR